MTLQTGARLGPYEILGPSGAGGMGEVYKARDTRLDRTVALKVIGAAVAGTPELRERFEREARTISQLNHPAICTLHDVGFDGDVPYLVLEYLEGEPLAARIERGPVPVDEALQIAIVVCEALDAAHRVGIVHRDLKPGNIMLVKSAKTGTHARAAQAKLLDFGLAKLSPAAASAALNGPSVPVTMTTPLTAQGSIIGTFQYMAPEQLEGTEADARSDIWAFGCVLYEMLTGRRAFEGKTQASLISAILATEPAPVSSVQPLAQPALEYTVRTCLAKNPDDRFQNAHDLLLQLRWMASAGSQAGVPAPMTARRRRRSFAWTAGITAAAVLATAAATWWLARPAASVPLPMTRAELVLPGSLTFNLGGSGNLAISPDGTRLVFSGIAGDDTRLRVREFGSTDVKALGESRTAIMPFFSPDGERLGFFDSGKLVVMPASGGAPTNVADMAGPIGATWLPDDTIVFSAGVRGLMRVPSAGGEPKPFTTIEPGEVDHRWPSALPDGSGVLYAAGMGASWNDARIVFQPLDGGPRTVLVQGGMAPQYLASGHVLYLRDGTLYALPFDARRGTATGAARPVVSGVDFLDGDGRAYYAVSPAGTVVFSLGSGVAPKRQLAWVTRDGKVQPLPVPERAYDHPRLSPDGRYLAMTVRDADADIWVLDLSRFALSRFTFESGEDESPIWTPDSTHIAFSASRLGKPRQTLWRAVDGSGVEEELFTTPRHQHLASWTPDGKTIVTEEVGAQWSIFSATLGEREWKPTATSRFHAQAVQLSPDGRWVAYASNEGTAQEVYVQAFPGPGGKSQVSVGGGNEPRWSPGGDELFYRSGDRMMAVKVRTTPAFSADTPRVLFEGKFTRMPWGQANYDVTRDGQRFLMVTGTDSPFPRSLQVITNWLEDVKALAPARR